MFNQLKYSIYSIPTLFGLIGAAEKSTKQGSDDKINNIISAMRERMLTREREHPEIFDLIRFWFKLSKLQIIIFLIIYRNVFSIDEKSHAGHMMAIKQSVLDGTSKWSAKIAITGNLI